MGAESAIGRERKFVAVDLDAVAGDGSFSGYASLFGRVDLGKDLVERGAFASSLARRGAAGIRMLFQHDPNEPIGSWTEVREDGKGLFVRGRLATGVARAREIHALMRGGAIDGLSIGFRTVKARSEAKTGVRRIIEADLWEISVVTFPMLPEARIGEVKGGGLPSLREFERWLVRDARLTRSEARTVIVKGFASLVSGRDAARDGEGGLADTIRRAARMMQPREN